MPLHDLHHGALVSLLPARLAPEPPAAAASAMKRGICPSCNQDKPITKAGVMREHQGYTGRKTTGYPYPKDEWGRCPGSGQAPKWPQ